MEVFGANSVAPNHGAFVFKNYGPLLPLVYDPLFLPQMFSHVKEHGIEYVYPAHDDVLITLSRHAADLGCAVIGSPCQTCELLRSKSATYARFSGLIPVPRLYAPMDERAPLPLFLKPDRGEGSRASCGYIPRRVVRRAECGSDAALHGISAGRNIRWTVLRTGTGTCVLRERASGARFRGYQQPVRYSFRGSRRRYQRDGGVAGRGFFK